MPAASLTNVLTNSVKFCQFLGSIQKETPPTAVDGVCILGKEKDNY